MTERRKHLFSLLLAFALVLGLPFPALAAGETVAINETNFPDPAFRTYVAERFDENEDHQLSQAERNDVQYIDVRGQDDSLGSITSLEGVEFFPNLEMLWCGYNRLSSLDLSGCSRLTYLNCEGNQINMLDVSGCKELETLECKDNNLITLDVSNNTALVLLYCENNEIAELDVSNAPSLQQLFCYNNKVLEESQGQAERTDFPQPGQKCPGRDAEDKSLHPGLAGLLRDSEHENNHAGMGRLAAPQIPVLHLEAMEESTDESKELNEVGYAPMAGIQEWKLSEGVLGSCR